MGRAGVRAAAIIVVAELLVVGNAALGGPAGATEVRLASCSVEEVLPDPDPTHQILDAELSDDGSTLMYLRYVDDHVDVVRYDVASDEREVVHEQPVLRDVVDVDADGSHVVLAGGGTQYSPADLWVLDVATGEAALRTPPGSGAVEVGAGQAISDDGSSLLAGRRGPELEGGQPTLSLIDVASGNVVRTIDLPADHRFLADPAISGDGTTATWTSWEGFWNFVAPAVEQLSVHRLDLDSSSPSELLVDVSGAAAGDFDRPTQLLGLSDDGERLLLDHTWTSGVQVFGDGPPQTVPVDTATALSGDGGTVLGVGNDATTYDIDAQASGATVPLGHGLLHGGTTSSADLATIAMWGREGGQPRVSGVFLVNPASGASTEVEATTPVQAPSISADGRTIATSTPQAVPGGDGGVTAEVVLQPEAGAALEPATIDEHTSTDAEISSDGRTVVFRSWADHTGENPEHAGELFALDRTGDEVEQLTETAAGTNEAPSPSEDGHVVAFLSTADHTGDNPDLEQHAFVLDRDTDEVEDLGAADQVMLSPDGRWVAMGDGQALRLHDRTDSLDTRPLLDVEGSLQRFSSDGAVLHVAGRTTADRTTLVHPIDLAVQRIQRLHAVNVHWRNHVAMSGDGQHLILEGGTNVYRLRVDDVAGQRFLDVWEGDQRRFADEDGSRWAQQPRGEVYHEVPDGRLEAVACPAFPDVPFEHPFSEEIEAMAADDVIGGYGNDTFRPGAPVTRQAMAAFLFRLAGAAGPAPTSAPFTDVSTSHPFATEIAWAADHDITTGYPDGTFRPGATVTRQATAAFLYRLTDAAEPTPTSAPFTDVPTSHPFATEIAWAADHDITTGYPDGTFKPANTVTRQATAAFLHRTQPLL